MTREELDEIIQTLPAVWVRWGIPRDLPEVLAIEAATGGRWEERDFREILRCKDHILKVAACERTYAIRGFVVYQLHDQWVRVLNLAAGDPVARRGLIKAIRDKAEAEGRSINWVAATY